MFVYHVLVPAPLFLVRFLPPPWRGGAETMSRKYLNPVPSAHEPASAGLSLRSGNVLQQALSPQAPADKPDIYGRWGKLNGAGTQLVFLRAWPRTPGWQQRRLVQGELPEEKVQPWME